MMIIVKRRLTQSWENDQIEREIEVRNVEIRERERERERDEIWFEKEFTSNLSSVVVVVIVVACSEI